MQKTKFVSRGFFFFTYKKKCKKKQNSFSRGFFLYNKKCKTRKINSFPRDYQPIKFLHYVVRT